MGLIGTAIGAAASIFGGIQASKAMKKMKGNIEAQKQANQNWYDRRYNEDATQRASAQAMLTRVEDAIKSRNKAAAGTQAVMGGTEESTAAAKAANNQVMADVSSRIVEDGERRKDAIEGEYREKDDQYQGQLNNLEANKAMNISKAIGGVTSAMGDLDLGTVKVGKKELDL